MSGEREGRKLIMIAETGERFEDFGPYVAAMCEDGSVAFAASVHGGRTGVFRGDGTTVEVVVAAEQAGVGSVVSHADMNTRGEACFYGETDGGERVVCVYGEGRVRKLAGQAGSLGPTMNEHGEVAYRTGASEGRGTPSVRATARAGIWTAERTGEWRRIAEAGERFRAFSGIPVINEKGEVAIGAERGDGRRGIYVWDGAVMQTVAETGAEFSELGQFPSMNAEGTVVFAGIRNREPGIYCARDGGVQRIIGEEAGLEHFRGAIVNDAGWVVFFATCSDGELGVYSGTGTVRRCVIRTGMEMMGTRVREFALNSVSINNRGQLAIRAGLADGRGVIVRAEGGTQEAECGLTERERAGIKGNAASGGGAGAGRRE